MSTRSRIHLVLAALFALGLLAGCGDVNSGDFIVQGAKWPWPRQADYRVSKTFSDQVPVSSQTRVQLEAENGHVSIGGDSTATAVSVSATLRVGSFDSREDAEQGLSQLNVRVTKLTDKILVETVQPTDPGGRQYVVDYTLTVPSDLDLDVYQVNGSVWLDGVAGSVFTDLSNGNIDGNVRVPVNGDVWLTTMNGDIALRIPRATSAELFASSDTGIVDVQNLELTGLVTTSRSVSGTLGAGAGDIHLETTNGSVVVTGFDE